MFLHPRTLEIVTGVSGSGKTLLARELMFDHNRIIVIDQRDEYHVGRGFTDFEAMARWCAAQERFVAVWKGDPEMHDAIYHLAFALQKVCILDEEAELYPLDENPNMREATLRGRMPAQISIIWNVQRPQLLAPDCRSQVTSVWAFRNSELSALQWLRSYFGPAVQEIATLPPLQGMVWRWGQEPAVEKFAVQP